MLKFLAGVVMGVWLTIKAQRTLRSWWNWLWGVWNGLWGIPEPKRWLPWRKRLGHAVVPLIVVAILALLLADMRYHSVTDPEACLMVDLAQRVVSAVARLRPE